MASETPMMDELEQGPWPSFVTEIKRAAEKKDSAKDLLKQQEQAFKEKLKALEEQVMGLAVAADLHLGRAFE